MATRRIVAQEKSSLLNKDDHTVARPSASGQSQKSNTSPAVPLAVIVKLLAFTFAMIVLPIGSYFVSVDHLFKGNSTYAGALAAIVANAVLIGYIIVAMAEDQSDDDEKSSPPSDGSAAGAIKEAKKDR
ncbi:VMA21-like domain-containing protein [Podospora conica]|nr:VMA21-like domain-containing protein [Schizothecium conicum]